MKGSGWADVEAVRVRLEAGADPNSGVYAFGGYDGKPPHLAAEWGAPESVAELARRVGDVDAEFDDRTDDADIEAVLNDPWADPDGNLGIVGVTDVPGGCVVPQPWGYAPSLPEVPLPLSVGTVCYSMFADPRSGNQGEASRDGVLEDSDTHPGGGDADGHMTADEILAEYLYQGQAVACCCATVGLRPPDARAVTGPPDLWLRLP